METYYTFKNTHFFEKQVAFNLDWSSKLSINTDLIL